MKTNKIFYRLVLLFASSLWVSIADAQVLTDYSALPETTSAAPDQTPNILFILDNSGSMRLDANYNFVGAHDPNSRSYAVREVLRGLLSNNVGDFNVGLMTFEGSPRLESFTFNVSDCGGYLGCGLSVSLWTRDQSGKGSLLSNLTALTSDKVSTLNTILGVEPELPTFSGSLNYYAPPFNRGYYDVLNTSIYANGALVSHGGTPLTGTLESAYDYLVTQSLTSDEVDLASGGSVVYPPYSTNISNDCRPNTYVFVITDGEPTVTNGGNYALDPQVEVTNAATAAATLRSAGIDTFLFGFQLPSSAASNLNQIAQGGAGIDAFLSSDAETLERQLLAAIDTVRSTAGSSSGISVVASASDTAGSVVQAIYNPEITGTQLDEDGNLEEVTVAWTSTLSAYFLDEFGYLREDNPSAGTPGKLDGYDVDSAFRLALEDIDSDGDTLIDLQEVRATRFTPTNFGTASFTEVIDEELVELEDLNPIWEAAEILGKAYDAATSDTQRAAAGRIYGQVNRPYSSTASVSNGFRHIFTWVEDSPGAGNFDQGSMVEFIFDSNASPAANTINANNYTLLAVDSPAEAQEVVEYIRGNEYLTPVGDDLRTRTIDNKSYLLGDIVHSTAAQVDTPNSFYNSRFGDDSYTAFVETYQNRRRMVYVGGNDGLLHAFNGGFFDGTEAQLNLVAPDGSDDVAHELGAEIWAYAPMNLLPHLKWLKRTDYDSTVHVSYVDGPIRSFDIRAFEEDSTHINGWGTIIVAGMRLGGGDYENIDPDADDTTNNTFTTRSAYVVLDVTDPRQPPEVIAEITHPNLGFTTGAPDIMKEGDDWYLVFGSGPNDITTATSVGTVDPVTGVATPRTPKFFRYKLNEGERGFADDGDGDDAISSTTGFVGDVAAQDWTASYSTDAVYFGVIEGTEAAPAGGMYRYITSHALDGANSRITPLVNVGQPVATRPLLKRFLGRNWVFFGAGRYYTYADAENETLNSFYGIKEPGGDYLELSPSALVDVTDVEVNADGTLSPSVAGQSSFNELRRYMITDSTIGWKYDYDFPSGNPATKNSAPPLSFRSLVFYTYYEPPLPDSNLCTNEFGESFLNVVDLVTGTASFTADFDGPLGLDNSGNIEQTASIGQGYAYQSYLFIGPDPETGKSRILIKSPLSTGEIADTPVAIPPRPNGRTSWREVLIQ